MSEDDLQRKMEFIVEQQAQFTVDIQKLQEAQAQTEQLVNRLAAATLGGFKDVNAKIDALVDAQMRQTEAQAHTDEKLQNLIAVADRYFREGLNGKS